MTATFQHALMILVELALILKPEWHTRRRSDKGGDDFVGTVVVKGKAKQALVQLVDGWEIGGELRYRL